MSPPTRGQTTTDAATQDAATQDTATQDTGTYTAAWDDEARQFHLGFERVRQEIEAIPKNDLEPINLAVGGVVQTVLGTIPALRPLRGELQTLGPFDLRVFDKLHDYALALGHTHAQHRCANGTPDTSLVKQLIATRERFHAEARVLVLRGILDGARVNVLRSGNSHQGIAYDVIGLCQLFLAAWDQFGGRSLLDREEIERARLAANQLVQLLAARQQRPNANTAITELRQKAYTLLIRSYNEVRAAIAFIRYKEGDVDDIIPSLYARRRKRQPAKRGKPRETVAPGEIEQADAHDATRSANDFDASLNPPTLGPGIARALASAMPLRAAASDHSRQAANDAVPTRLHDTQALDDPG